MPNGDFEARLGWLTLTDPQPRYCTTQPYAGEWAMCLGIEPGGTNLYRYSSVEQTLQLPANAQVSLSFWYYPISTDSDQDRQYVLIVDPNGNYTPLVWVLSNAQTWLHKAVDLSHYAGQSITLRFGVYNDGKGGVTAMRLDQVSLQVCTQATPPARLWLPLIRKSANASVAQAAVAPTLSIDEALPQRPLGLAVLSEPLRAVDAARIDALALDAQHRRVISVSKTTLTIRDAITGRELLSRELPGRVSRLLLQAASRQIVALLAEQGELHLLDGDGSTLAVVGKLGYPANAVEGDGRLYVADSAGKRILVLDGASLAVLSQRELPAAPYALAYDPTARRLYVGQMGTGQLLALDADSLETIAEVALGGLGYPQDLALDTATHSLYVAHALSPKYGALSVIDTASMTVRRTRWGNQEQSMLGSDFVHLDTARDTLFVTHSGGCLVLASIDLTVRTALALDPEVITGMAGDTLEGILYLTGAGGQLWTWQAATP